MARKVVVTVVDDYDGVSAADEMVAFGVDGVSYEIDLSAENARSLRKFLEQWTPYARRTGRAARSRNNAGGGRSAASREDVAAIRAWAKENGHEISARGRVPSEIVAAYRAAQSG
ncbi:Lsr2 family protein [Nocardia sp. NPDC057353]|uniref:histone-like nucleoid-structuring protein Lsr2 n=1 Tax=Nocardia sp. NPDC057353 TaxID=3346104 RepID=UPI003630DD08